MEMVRNCKLLALTAKDVVASCKHKWYAVCSPIATDAVD